MNSHCLPIRTHRFPSLVLLSAAAFLAFASSARSAEFHVATSGTDSNPGTKAAPFRTIQHAADLAQPGDVITVHKGVYRERVNPPRGGESDSKRIVYRAAPGEKVEIKGSEVVKNWEKAGNDTWKVVLPNSFFGAFNPYADLIHGDWFEAKGRAHHTGAVYLNGEQFAEAANLDELLSGTASSPVPGSYSPLWFGQADPEKTTVWAQFKGVDPNKEAVEINVRRTVFYPDKPGRNYITVRGFTMCNAATPWAPPTAEQAGLIGTHWSRGWIIENNVISHSICSGVALGKYGDEWDNKAQSAEGYVGTIKRGLANGWSRDKVGGHVVRRNEISHCGQTGIVGSLGAAFSTISDNSIHDINLHQTFGGAEMAGIKFHGAIDVVIRHNHIYHCSLGLWLDWMAQNARVSANLFDDNGCDVFFEVDHGPILMDNNLCLSKRNLLYNSQGVALVHNLFAGRIDPIQFDERETPFHKAHSTELAGLHNNPCGDTRYYNNLLTGGGDLRLQYDEIHLYGPAEKWPAEKKEAAVKQAEAARLPSWMDGNVFFNGSHPSKNETNPLVVEKSNPEFKLVEKEGRYYLDGRLEKGWTGDRTRKLVTSKLLGNAVIPDLPFDQPDGAPYRLDTDFFKKKRNADNPAPGPFESLPVGKFSVRVW